MPSLIFGNSSILRYNLHAIRFSHSNSVVSVYVQLSQQSIFEHFHHHPKRKPMPIKHSPPLP